MGICLLSLCSGIHKSDSSHFVSLPPRKMLCSDIYSFYGSSFNFEQALAYWDLKSPLVGDLSDSTSLTFAKVKARTLGYNKMSGLFLIQTSYSTQYG